MEAIGAAAEIIRAIAVTITLVYLAVQVKQSNLSARVSARLDMTRHYSDYTDLIVGDPEARRVYWSGRDGEPLGRDDKALFGMLMHKFFWCFSAMHYQWAIYDLSADDFHQSKTLMTSFFRRPGVIAWWEESRDQYDKAFAKFIDEQVIQPNAIKSTSRDIAAQSR